MAIDERTRHELHQRLDEVLGPEPAATLMAHLPPVGWGDVATTRDLELSEQRITTALHRELQHQQRFYVTVMMAWGSVLVGVAFAAARLS